MRSSWFGFIESLEYEKVVKWQNGRSKNRISEVWLKINARNNIIICVSLTIWKTLEIFRHYSWRWLLIDILNSVNCWSIVNPKENWDENQQQWLSLIETKVFWWNLHHEQISRYTWAWYWRKLHHIPLSEKRQNSRQLELTTIWLILIASDKWSPWPIWPLQCLHHHNWLSPVFQAGTLTADLIDDIHQLDSAPNEFEMIYSNLTF
jgi:hypothetical protein